jgi:hypothetical protein
MIFCLHRVATTLTSRIRDGSIIQPDLRRGGKIPFVDVGPGEQIFDEEGNNGVYDAFVATRLADKWNRRMPFFNDNSRYTCFQYKHREVWVFGQSIGDDVARSPSCLETP